MTRSINKECKTSVCHRMGLGGLSLTTTYAGMPGGCYDQEKACYATGNDTICQNADNFCFNT